MIQSRKNMRWNGYLSFIKILIFIVSPSILLAQEPISFEKHNWKKNTMSGHVWQKEFIGESGYINTSDYDYEDAFTKGVFYFGGGIKFGFKNQMNRGFSIGPGIDWTNNKYLRLNLLIDLDFLFQYSIDMGKGRNFTPSMFTKFSISKVFANVNGEPIQEYYFKFNIFQLQIGRIAFAMSASKGLFRNKYPPYFADKGSVYSLSYIFKK